MLYACIAQVPTRERFRPECGRARYGSALSAVDPALAVDAFGNAWMWMPYVKTRPSFWFDGVKILFERFEEFAMRHVNVDCRLRG